MRRFKSARQLQRFTSTHDQVANLFMRCRHTPKAQAKREARTQAFAAWKRVSCAPMMTEQDHRGVKSRTGPMLGFKVFDNAAITIAGIELLNRIRKAQFALGRLRVKGQAAPAIWEEVLNA